MGVLTFFLQRRALGRLLGGTRGAQAARSGGFFTGTLRKAALAGDHRHALQARHAKKVDSCSIN